MSALATIGVYGWNLDAFLHALAAADVALLLDVRQRRGVRGSDYTWANSLRLQDALAQAGIAYRHHPERDPEACHRSLVARRMADHLGLELTDLRP